MENEFGMIINGRNYTGCWESIEVFQSMQHIAGGIGVKTTDFFPERNVSLYR